jgi:hypothetical protein
MGPSPFGRVAFVGLIKFLLGDPILDVLAVLHPQKVVIHCALMLRPGWSLLAFTFNLEISIEFLSLFPKFSV